MAEQMVAVDCAYCGQSFQKRLAEYNRAKKQGRRHFCSRSHSVSGGNISHPRGDASRLDPRNRRDLFTPFRFFTKLAKRRAKETPRKEFDLDLQYLKQLWELQNGRCAFTGWELQLPYDANGWVTEDSIK